MKILIIGKGGREHALAWKCRQSPLVKEVFAIPGSEGIKTVATTINVDENNKEEILKFATTQQIDLTIVGPETVLADGLVDLFKQHQLKIFGPSKQAAQIESSKDFCKKILEKYNIPTAQYKTFYNCTDAIAHLRQIKNPPFVIKEDGLKAGKGVSILQTLTEAEHLLQQIFSISDNKVVIEEFLEGFEFSLIALVHDDIVIPFDIAQDHKRIGDGDTGANTGGMGVYSPVKKITPDIINDAMNKIMKPMAQAMIKEDIPFTGFLYGGLMLTKNGIKTIEFNARFGDPEAEILLPKLESDLVESILKIMNKHTFELQFSKHTFVGVVLASAGYPDSNTKGAEIKGLEKISSQVFHMGTDFKNKKWLTNGGRVLLVLNKADNLEDARKKVYADIQKIESTSLIFRKDIGIKDIC